MKKDFIFKCSTCGKEYPIEKGRYLCDDCAKKQEEGKPLSGLLFVEIPDSIIFKYKNNPEKIIDIIRLNSNNIFSLDVLPFFPIDNLSEIAVGNTPIIRSERLEKELDLNEIYLKCDGANLSGSFKDRASILVSTVAKDFRQDNIVVASTGNAASSMAAIGAANNQNIFIFAPKTAPTAKLAQILQYGARLFLIDGTYDDAFELSMKFSNETKFLSRNTGYNPFTIEGKKSVAFELLFLNEKVFDLIGFQNNSKSNNAMNLRMNSNINLKINLNNFYKILTKCGKKGIAPFEPADFILVPVGDGVIISGLIKGILDLLKSGLIDRLPVVIGIQAKGSSYISDLYEKNIAISNYKADTIADSISVNSPRCGYMAVDLVKKTGGFFIKVDDDEILNAQHLLAKTSGIFAEPSSCTTIAALIKENNLFKNKKVVALLTGNGLKDINSALKLMKLPLAIENNFNSVMDYFKSISNQYNIN